MQQFSREAGQRAPASTAADSSIRSLSVAARAAIAKPMDALDAALAADAALPPPATDRERLERMGRIDQSWRRYMNLDLHGLTPDEVKAVYAAITAKTESIDHANLDRVMAIRPPQGWFGISAYGAAASEAAFHIVNHGDTATQKLVLPAIEAMAKRGEADPTEFATMYDRIQVADGKPQRYGTQYDCFDHHMAPYPLEDADKVEALRAHMKFAVTLAEQAKAIHDQGTCEPRR